MAQCDVVRGPSQYVLVLTEEEAQVLLYVVGSCIVGRGKARRLTDKLYFALEGVVPPRFFAHGGFIEFDAEYDDAEGE